MFNLFKFGKLLLELKAENKKLKNELHVSNCRIVDSAKEIESLKIDHLFYYSKACSLQQSLEDAQAKLIQQDGLPFVDDAKDALKDYIPEWNANTTYFGGEEVMFNGKKCFMGAGVGNTPILEEEKAFTSWFMPNVKFKINGTEENLISVLSSEQLKAGCKYFKIPSFGKIIGARQEILFRYWNEKEVSIYEAIPELVPSGMVYDKESDSLKPKKS